MLVRELSITRPSLHDIFVKIAWEAWGMKEI